MDLHVLRSPESENHTFSVWCECLCVCVSDNSITQKQITAEISNLIFYIWIMYRCNSKHFIGQKSVHRGTGIQIEIQQN